MQPTESTQMAQLLRKLGKQYKPIACHPTDLSVLAQHSDVEWGDNEKETPVGLLTETQSPTPCVSGQSRCSSKGDCVYEGECMWAHICMASQECRWHSQSPLQPRLVNSADGAERGGKSMEAPQVLLHIMAYKAEAVIIKYMFYHFSSRF